MMIGLISTISPITSFAQQQKSKKAKETKSEDKNLTTTKPELKTPGDTLAYLFGAMQSNGLKDYIVKQLNVDTTYLEDFYKGLADRTSADPTDKKLAAYNAGLSIGGQLENMATNVSKDYYETEAEKNQKIDIRIIANSLLAALKGQNEYNAKDAGDLFQKTLAAKKEANLEIIYADNKKEGEQFLDANKRNAGVTTLPSGLQYKILTQGAGPIPKATDKVSVNYEGHLIDGTEFDSSYKRNKPQSFKCNQVIKGWTEALTHMPVGSKWEVYIPYDLAYGTKDTGKIKPYSTLIFTVELLDIEEEATPVKTTTPTSTTTKTTTGTKTAAKPVSIKKTTTPATKSSTTTAKNPATTKASTTNKTN